MVPLGRREPQSQIASMIAVAASAANLQQNLASGLNCLSQRARRSAVDESPSHICTSLVQPAAPKHLHGPEACIAKQSILWSSSSQQIRRPSRTLPLRPFSAEGRIEGEAITP